ncbi:MAG: PadR family transcriptional regulator [Candidatus Bathyarchaeota archaeon]|nr:MAG: PadR family transcriptional regulator [Candidatus Bathyarchaeota archaeon]
MFPRHAEIKERLHIIIEKLRQKGAISPDKAVSVEELGLPPELKDLMKDRLARLGVLVEVNGKLYLSEQRLKEVEELFEHPPPQFPHLLRHTASVPKGFLRYFVIKLLKEKPVSGSEIMEEIEKESQGNWKPSPGSVYPLLAWLQDNSYTKEIPTEESGIKRYMLTEKGEKLFEEQTEFGRRLRRKLEFLAPPFFSGFWLSPHSEKLREIREPTRRFIKALLSLRRNLEENLTEQALKEVRAFLNSTAEKLEELSSRLKEGEKNG